MIPSGNYKENLRVAGICRRSGYFECCIIRIYRESMADENPELAKKNNVRDFASINELTVLSNLETHNAQMIREGEIRQKDFKF